MPLHIIYLDTFQIDKYEVINDQYSKCVNCTAPNKFGFYSRSFYFNNPTCANHPVILVNWYQASDYCTWAGKRLSIEPNWEKAARGSSDTRAYP